MKERHVRNDGHMLEHRGGYHLSRPIQDFIDQCLHHKMCPVTIVAEAKCKYLQRMQLEYNLPSHASVLEALDKGTIPMHRDFSISAKDVSNRRAAMDKQLWKFTDNDAENVRFLYLKEKSNFLLYQEQSESTAFIAVLQSPWQRKKLLELGHDNAILMDATFNTNKQKVLLFPQCYMLHICIVIKLLR